VIFSDHRRMGGFGFTQAELDQWAGIAVTDPKLAAELVKKSVTPLPQQPISCPAGYVYDQTTSMCHLLPKTGTSPLVIFGALAGAALLFAGRK